MVCGQDGSGRFGVHFQNPGPEPRIFLGNPVKLGITSSWAKMDSNFELPRPRYVLLCIFRTGRAFGAKIQHSQNAGKVSVHAVRTIVTDVVALPQPHPPAPSRNRVPRPQLRRRRGAGVQEEGGHRGHSSWSQGAVAARGGLRALSGQPCLSLRPRARCYASITRVGPRPTSGLVPLSAVSARQRWS